MAVYTEVPPEALRAFLADYALGELRGVQGIAEGVENSNFRLETDRGRYILTIYEKRVDPADLPFFLGLMEHLAQRGLPCPLPVHGRDLPEIRRVREARTERLRRRVWRVRIEVVHPHESPLACPLREIGDGAVGRRGRRPLRGARRQQSSIVSRFASSASAARRPHIMGFASATRAGQSPNSGGLGGAPHSF